MKAFLEKLNQELPEISLSKSKQYKKYFQNGMDGSQMKVKAAQGKQQPE